MSWIDLSCCAKAATAPTSEIAVAATKAMFHPLMHPSRTKPVLFLRSDDQLIVASSVRVSPLLSVQLTETLSPALPPLILKAR